MAKAKLTTRGISASTVTSDNLAKGSQLTHNQLDSNFINLRDQSFGIAADDSATIQVGAGDTIYIQGGTNITTATDSAGVVIINGAGTATSLTTDGLTIIDNNITGTRSNEDIRITANGGGDVIIDTDLLQLGSGSETAMIRSNGDNNLELSGGVDDEVNLTLTGADTAAGASALISNQQYNIFGTGSALAKLTSRGEQHLVLMTDSGNGTAKLSLNNDSGVAVTGTLSASGTITASGALVVTGATTLNGISIVDHTITTNESNANMFIEASGTGTIQLENLSIAGDGATVTGILDEDAMGTNSAVKLATQQSIKAYADSVVNLIDEDNMSTNSATRPPSQQSVKAYVDAEVSGAGGGGNGFKIIGDDSAGVDIADGGTLYVQGGTGITTATDSAGVITINGQVGDVTSVVAGAGMTGGGTDGDVTLNVIGGTGITANANDIAIDSTVATLAGSQTFTNKTIDANGTGNDISNIDIANMTAASVVLEAEGIASNDNDTTLPTSAAVKDYADTKAVLSGSTNNNVATVTGAHALVGEGNLTFDGSTLAVTGAATVSTTLGVTGASNLDGVTITDNTISTNDSNANLVIGTNGTGNVEIGTTDTSIFDGTKYTDFFGSTDNIRGVVINTNQEVNANTTGRNYMNVVNQDTKLTASSSGNSNFRQRTMLVTNTTDMAGFDYTRSGFSRGPIALTFGSTAMNTGGSASTLKTIRGFDAGVGIYISTASNLASDLTINAVYGANSTIYSADDDGSASGTATVDNAYNYRASYYKTSGDVITNIYAYYNEGAEDNAATNRYAFYSLDAGASSRMGAIRLDNTGDPTHGDGFGWIFAKDDSGSSEVHVVDEAGNITKISPHNTAGDWEYYSKNTITGKTVRVNMEAMIKDIEQLTGKTYIETE